MSAAPSSSPESGLSAQFRYPVTFLAAGTLLLALSSLVWFILLAAMLSDIPHGLGTGFILITLFCLGFALFGLWLIFSHRPAIEVTPEALLLKAGSKVKSAEFSRIIAVRHKTSVFRSLELITETETLVIHKNIGNYEQLWGILKSRLSLISDDAAEDNLRIRCSYGAVYLSAAVFLLLSLAIAVLGWYVFLSGQSRLVSALVITAVLLPFIAALAWLILKTPRFYVFRKNVILVQSLVRRTEYQISQITGFRYGQRFVKVHAKIGSHLSHFVELEFEGGRRLVIDNTDTAHPIEKLADYLIKAYNLKQLKAAVTPNQDGHGSAP